MFTFPGRAGHTSDIGRTRFMASLSWRLRTWWPYKSATSGILALPSTLTRSPHAFEKTARSRRDPS
eukprot:6352698-Alexandrium_andersonii.AAC.1